MQRLPLVSVIVTSYNYADYVEAAIESVLAQTYPVVDLIVVDDGSTDGSIEKLHKYEDVARVISKPNGGQGSAFNAGIDAARGDVVAFLDADDRWYPTKLASMWESGRFDPDVAMVYHRVALTGPLGAGRGVLPRRVLSGDLRRRVSRSGGYWPYAPTSALAFPRSYLDRVGPVPEDRFRICADAYLAELAPFLGQIIGLEDVLAEYRLHGSNQWNDAARLAGDPATVTSHIKQFETRVASINARLGELGLDERVDISDHWPYERLRLRNGDRQRRPSVRFLWRGLTFPGEPRLPTRIKNTLRAARELGPSREAR